MDDNNVKQELFACCITDGILDGMSSEQRAVIILDINEIKESMLKDNPPRATKKYQNKGNV
jgi:hypothetical protein